MLSRIMRNPAGFMKKALGGNFLSGAFKQNGPATALPPDYWTDRFSNLGMVLIAPLPPFPGVASIHPSPSAPGADGMLAAQGGKAASFLGIGPLERAGTSRS